jgi:hypothetical protein
VKALQVLAASTSKVFQKRPRKASPEREPEKEPRTARKKSKAVAPSPNQVYHDFQVLQQWVVSLSKLGKLLWPTQVDGNCLFDSFRLAMYSFFPDKYQRLTIAQVRHAACQEMQEWDFPRRAQSLITDEHQTAEQYVSKMRQDRVWGGTFQLGCLARAYAVTIKVVTLRPAHCGGNLVAEFHPRENDQRLTSSDGNPVVVEMTALNSNGNGIVNHYRPAIKVAEVISEEDALDVLEWKVIPTECNSEAPSKIEWPTERSLWASN